MSRTIAERTARIDLAAIDARLEGLSMERLKARFWECAGITAELLAEMAMIIRRIKEGGGDLTGFHNAGTLLRIASGQLLAEFVWKFAESPNRRLLERLSLDDQARLAEDSMVEVVEGKAVRMVDLVTAPADVARLAIGPDGIRTPEEQRAYLGVRRVVPATRKALEERIPEVPLEPLDHEIRVKFTASEWKAISVQAAERGIPQWKMIREILSRAGAFKPSAGPARR